MTRLHTIPQPVIAKVHGVATAAGCQLVAACDLAIASDDARFATPGVNIGLFCSTPMVPVARTIGRKRALEMLFTGEMIDARDRRRWGLVNRVVPPPTARRRSVDARRDASRSRARTVLALGKRAFYAQDGLAEAAAYDLACAGDGRQRAGRRRARRHARVPREAGAAVAETDSRPSTASRAGFDRVRAAAASRVRAAVDRRVRLEHRHVDGDDRARHLRQKHTDQAAWTGTVAAAAFVPIAFFGPIGGALADRFPRKLLLMIDDASCRPRSPRCSRCCSSIGHPSAPTITLIAFGNGICAALGFPAFQAMLPDLVPVEDLPGRDRARRRRSTTSGASSAPRSRAS